MIHSTAIIDSKAEVPGSVSVGPFVVIDAGVKIGEGCSIGPFVHITGDSKRAVFEQACSDTDPRKAPISAVLNQSTQLVHLYWAP